jgi:hypothetical protein
LNDPTTASAARQRYLIAGLTLLAFVLRAWGTGYGFPLPHARPDEDRWVRIGLGLLEDPDPRWFEWPSLHAYLLAVVYAIWGAFRVVRGDFPSFHAYMNEDQRVYLSDLVLLGRLMSSFIGALVVPATWKLAQKVGARGGLALWAGFFMAISFGPVRDGHWALIEPLLLVGITVTLVAIVRALERGTWKAFLVAALLAGLTTSAKYSAATLAAPIALAVLFVRRREGRSVVGTLWDPRLVAGGLVMIAAFFAGSPFILVSTRQFHDAMVLREWSYRDASFGTDVGFIHHLRFSLRYSHGVLMELAGLLGLLILGWRRPARAVVMVYAVATYVALGPARIIPMRYGCSLAPAIALGACWAVEWLRERGAPAVVATLLLSSMSAEPLYRVVRFDTLLTRTDTRAAALEWFAGHVPVSAEILTRDSKALRWVRPPLEQHYDVKAIPEDPDEAERALARRVRRGWDGYVLLQESFTGYAPFVPELHAVVRRYGAMVAVFDPFSPTAQPLYDPHDAFFVPVAGFEGVHVPGPRLTVYRIGPGTSKAPRSLPEHSW